MFFQSNSYFSTSRIVVMSVFSALLIALVALTGWIFHIKSLTTFNTEWPSIKVNTAIGIILGVVSLLLFFRKKNVIALLLAMVAFLLGVVSLSEYVFHWNAHIDELFFSDTWTPEDKYPGRMATFTTFAIIITGISLITYSYKKRWILRVSEFSAILLFILSFTGFVGALYDAGQLFRLANIASFSIPTALAGLLMSFALLFSKQDTGLVAVFYKKTSAAKAGLKGIFVIIIMLVFIGWLCLKGYRTGVFDREMGIVVMIATFTISFLFVAWSGIRRVNMTEHRLKSSEKKLHQVLSSTGDIFYVINKSYIITLLNETAERDLTNAWGKPVKLGSNILDLVPPEKDEPIRRSFEKVFAGEKIEYEINHTRSDLPSWVSVSYTPVRNDDGTIIGAYVVTKDISERKKAEEELRQANNRFEMITRTTNDAIWEWDLVTGKLWSNETHQRLYGLTLSDPVPSEDMWIARIHPNDRERMINRQAEALASNQNVFISEYRFKAEGAGDRNIYDRCYIVRDNDGRPLRMVGSMMDITERKKIEDALAKSENHLRTIVQAEPECVKLVNSNGELEDMNSAGLAMIEADNLEQVKGKSLSDIISEPYRTAFENLRQNVFQGRSGMLEFEIIGLKGTHRWLETHAVPLKNVDGKIVSLLGVTRDITERKKAEDELKKSEQRYRSLIEQASDYIMITDMKGNFTDVNSSLCKMFGYTREELLRKNISDIIDPAQLKDDPMRFDLLGSGQSVLRERRMMSKNGSIIEVEANVKMLPDGRVLAIARDIKERKKAEQAIRASEETRRLIMDSALDAIVCIDTAGKVTVWTPQAAKMFGWEEEEIINKKLADTIIPLKYRELHKKGLEKYSKTGEGKLINSLVEITAINKKGEEFPIELSIVPFEQGGKTFFCGFVRNISERIKAQQQIKKEKDLSDSVINSLPGLFYLFDDTGKYLRWNKLKETLTGYSAEEIATMSPLDFFEGKEKDLVKKRIEEGFRNGETMLEASIVSKSGQKYPFYFTGIAIEYEGKQCLLGTGIDISDRKRAEEQIKQSYEQIRQLTEHLQNIREEERTHIAREIHDELGQQLTVLKMDASWLNKKLVVADINVTQKVKGLIELLDRTVKTVRRISSELRPSLLDDMGLVAAMDWHLKEFGKRSSVKTAFSAPGKELSLPDTMKTGLFRIFQESLTNVARHADAKKVNVVLKQKNGQLILSIEDDGKGFEKEKIFNQKTLGILGMKERSAMMGGSYDVSSIPGKGTKVLVSVFYE